MPEHCPGCCGAVRDGVAVIRVSRFDNSPCPGCGHEAELARLREHYGYAEKTCEKLRADLAAAQEELARLREQVDAAEQAEKEALEDLKHWHQRWHESEQVLAHCNKLLDEGQARENAMVEQLARLRRVVEALYLCESSRGQYSTAPAHDCRCEKDRGISRKCTCGGDELREAQAELA